MAEYSRIAKGHFTSTGAAQVVNLPFQPDAIEMWNYSSFATPAQHGVPYAYWDVSMGQGFAVEDVFQTVVTNTVGPVTAPGLTTDVVTSNGFSTFAAGQLLQFGAKKQVIGATKANPIVFNVTAHGYKVGDTVTFVGLYQSATTGMPQIDGMLFTISAVGDADHFTVKWNGNQSNYTALSASPSGAYVMKVLYPALYAPGVAFVEAVTTGTTTTVVTTNYHNFVVGQEIAFRIPAAWGITQLNSLPNTTIPGSPIYGYVVSVTDNWTFVCNINSTGYTAYNSNQPVASVAGQQFPQVVAVGDVNTGGVQISAGSQLYPPPFFPTGSGGVNTINGPAIQGAFVNNTSQGFVIGAGAGATDTSSVLVGANGNVIYWRALLSDLSVN